MLSLTVYSQDKKFDSMLKDLLNDIDAPLIRVSEVKKEDQYIFLDARKKIEFETSHIPGAFHVGEEGEFLPKLNSEKQIIVYCSVGYRSGKVAEELRKQGYKAFNLYGGIFEWVHQNKTIQSLDGSETKKVHTYNKKWSKWLTKGEKIY